MDGVAHREGAVLGVDVLGCGESLEEVFLSGSERLAGLFGFELAGFGVDDKETGALDDGLVILDGKRRKGD